jgi:uncharacterized protein (DUF1778 family)
MTDTVSRHERIDLRTTAEMKALIRHAAAAAGVSVSAFLLDAAQERARQVLAESMALTLSPRDWEAFFTALDNVDKQRPKLQAAMRRYRERELAAQ